MLFFDLGRQGPSGGRLPSPLNNRCDLALFGEHGNNDRGVLVVRMRFQLKFRKTVDSDGLPYSWTSDERKTFVRDATLAIKGAWDDKFRITTTSTVPDKAFRDVGVLFSLSMQIGGLSVGEDYELTVKKVGSYDDDGSHVHHNKRTGQLDNRTTIPRPSGVSKDRWLVYQQPVAHEFGHLLGLRDEYPDANAPNPNWLVDTESILHSGSIVRPRHYVPFAAWLTQKFARQSRRSGVTTTFKVDGRRMGMGMWDETNALL